MNAVGWEIPQFTAIPSKGMPTWVDFINLMRGDIPLKGIAVNLNCQPLGGSLQLVIRRE